MFQFCHNKTCFLALMLKTVAAFVLRHSLLLIEGNVGVLSQDPSRWEGSHRRDSGRGTSAISQIQNFRMTR